MWVVDRRGWVVVVVVDRRAGMKGVVGRGSAAEVGRGRGWVVAEVALIMTFFEWVCSGGFQIGSGDDFFLSAWVCVCLCLCLWFVVFGLC